MSDCGHLFSFKIQDGVLFNWTNCQLCGAPPLPAQMDAMRALPEPGGTYAPAVSADVIPFGDMHAVAAAVDESVPSASASDKADKEKTVTPEKLPKDEKHAL